MIGIIGAMAPEMALLGAALQNSRERTAAGMIFKTGTLEGKNVVLLQCGVGKVNAAVGTALLVELFHPAAVLNTGSAGGLKGTGRARSPSYAVVKAGVILLTDCLSRLVGQYNIRVNHFLIIIYWMRTQH